MYCGSARCPSIIDVGDRLVNIGYSYMEMVQQLIFSYKKEALYLKTVYTYEQSVSF